MTRTSWLASICTALRTTLAPLGLAGSGPIPEGVVLPVDPVAAIGAGSYHRVPVLAGNTRDEAKLFPTFPALSTARGGASGRLVSDATRFATQFDYDPDAAPTVDTAQWMMTSLGAFARHGDPNAPAALGVTWPVWPSMLLFDATATEKVISVQ